MIMDVHIPSTIRRIKHGPLGGRSVLTSGYGLPPMFLFRDSRGVSRQRQPRTQSARAAPHSGGNRVWSRHWRSSALQAATHRGSGGGGGGGGVFTRPQSINISTRRFLAATGDRGLALPWL